MSSGLRRDLGLSPVGIGHGGALSSRHSSFSADHPNQTLIWIKSLAAAIVGEANLGREGIDRVTRGQGSDGTIAQRGKSRGDIGEACRIGERFAARQLRQQRTGEGIARAGGIDCRDLLARNMLRGRRASPAPRHPGPG